MTAYRCQIFCLFALAILMPTSACRLFADEPQEDNSRAEVVPVMIAEAGNPIIVRYNFVNDSVEPIGYLLSHRKDVHRLELILTRQGMPIPPRETFIPPVLAKSRVRIIKPGGFVRHEIELNEVYGQLDPGRYKVTVRYSGSEFLEKEYGITNMSFEHTLMWIELTAMEKTGGPED